VYSEFISKLYDLYCIYSERGTPIVMGDFNADITGLKDRKRDVDLIGFLQDFNLRAVNTLKLSYGSLYTYVPYDDSSYSTIDYMCIPVDICYLVVHCEVADAICLKKVSSQTYFMLPEYTYLLYRT